MPNPNKKARKQVHHVGLRSTCLTSRYLPNEVEGVDSGTMKEAAWIQK